MNDASVATAVPLTVIGGFLGAGKTTLVNGVLERAEGRRLAILVNDFGALSIDAALISSRSAHTVSLANGCVCCRLVNGLAQGLIDVLRLDPLPDHVLVEASGVADPRRIAQIARADRAFMQDATWVVVAADQIRALAVDRYVADTVLRQLDAADFIVLNKIDVVSQADAEATADWLRVAAPRARIASTRRAQVPIDVLLGPRSVEIGPDFDAKRTRHVHAPTDHSAAFESRTLRCGHPISESALRDALDALPDTILRVKGFVRVDSAPERVQLVQRVGRRCSVEPAPRGALPTGCVLVVISAAKLSDEDLDRLARVFAVGAASAPVWR